MPIQRRIALAAPFALAAALALCAATPVRAQGAGEAAYPAKPITFLVPYAAGGPTDLVARQLAHGLNKLWGQPVVVDNRVGASGIVALTALARAPADGYTLGIMVSPVTAIAPLTQSGFPYDVVKDFTAVSDVVDYALVLMAGPQTGAKSLKELVEHARNNPNKVSYGSSGVGGTNHLAGELFSRSAGAPMMHVPYKGNAPALNDVMAGQVSFMFAQTDSAIGMAKSGKVRALGITSPARNPALPDVPTMAESGFAGVDVNGWTGVMGPANLPPAVLKKLEEGIAAVKQTPEFRQKMESLGFVVTGTSSKAFGQRVQKERDFWKAKITEAKIPLQ
jgi:tripartite-type tricarboxylate transporter receptor subunit TctC